MLQSFVDETINKTFYCDNFQWNSIDVNIIYMSIYGFAKDIKKLARQLSKKKNYKLMLYVYDQEKHNVLTEYIGELGHLVIYHKSSSAENLFYVYSYEEYGPTQLKNGNISSDFLHQVYLQLKECSCTPFLESWMSYILKHASISSSNICRHFDTRNDKCIYAYRFTYSESMLQNCIQTGLQDKSISMGDNAKASEKIHEINNLNDYLSAFAPELEDKINSTYQPVFDSRKESYDIGIQSFDTTVNLRRGISLLKNQKEIINAVVRRLQKNYSAVICGNMGSGKTIMSIGCVYAHKKKEFTNNIILCPGHLVEKWQRELKNSYPCVQTIICSGLQDFSSNIEPLLDDKNRKTNLFIIMSKDTAKGAFELSPAVVYDPIKSKKAQSETYHALSRVGYYRCPHCGTMLETNHKKDADKEIDSGSISFFAKQTDKGKFKNHFCPTCGESLWQPSLGKNSRWLKIPKFGWVHRRVLETLYDWVKDVKISNLSSAEDRLLATSAIQWHNKDADFLPERSRKVSLAKYIYRKYRNKIDYLIADEMHQFSAQDSIQAEMFALMVRTAKHTIGLTGTLMNGYASNLFYLLFRMFPKAMLRNGYTYKDAGKFAKTYGVTESISKTNLETNRRTTTTKYRPGVSPTVFTNFLLDSCVFLNLNYEAAYNETPVGVSMPEKVSTEYMNIKDNVCRLISDNVLQNGSSGNPYKSKTYKRMLMQAMQLLALYPDQPYNQIPVYNYDTNKVTYKPKDTAVPDEILPKEEKALEIAREAVARGEHVLIYTYWTNCTDSQEKLKRILQEAGLSAEILSASVKAKERENWIQKKTAAGMNVLICNPSLIETGLDLLDFTTIIFFQLGYKLTTMRQASKRSYRLNQKNAVHVYFLYYEKTIQEQALAIMALKLHAATVLEGKLDAEGLAAVNSDDTDILSQLAKTVVDEKQSLTVEHQNFESTDLKENVKFVKEEASDTVIHDPFDTYEYYQKNKRKLTQQEFLPSMISW